MQKRFHSLISQNNTLFKQVLPSYRINIRSVVLSYRIFGETTKSEEPPVFLFHSLLSGKKQWKGIGKTLFNVTKRSVVAVDLRNHGDSPHTNTHRYLELAEDIKNLFKKLGVQQASLIGHSMGGKAAMCLALMELAVKHFRTDLACGSYYKSTAEKRCLEQSFRILLVSPKVDVHGCNIEKKWRKLGRPFNLNPFPLLITGVLVLDISPASPTKHYRDDYPKILTAMKKVDFKNPKTLPSAKAEAKNQLKSLVVDDYLLRCILSNIRLRKNATIGWNININVLLNEIEYIADFPKSSLKGKKYFGPTLLLGGQFSDLLPPEDLSEIRDMFPKAVISYIPKTRHNVHIDDPKSFLEIAISFIRHHHFKKEFKPPTLNK